ncbi:MAG: PEP-CTERM sorting domain-containing protein [Pirellulaceae bacterium]|nr:PEP-CTERM sorting domain-containing protein [Planctomycetaceae bacterium]MDG2384885.1 PEP-CTERM sorting domain-containing protein [Pirellulaceae bacterium]
MKKLLCLPILLIGVSLLQAGETGAPLPLTNGSVDGWSGVTVLNGAGSIPAGESVSTVTYYAEASRASGEHHVQPLILKNVDGVAEIWGIGPVSNATDAGENSVSWGSDAIPDDGNDYFAGFWQYRDGFDDDAGGTVTFGGDGGSGMFQANRVGTDYTPAVGEVIESGHASGAGGRNYQINFLSVPEPTSLGLIGLAILPMIAMLRRRMKR